MSIRHEIGSEFETVARQQNHTLQPLTDDLPLHETGLDSLCFAIIVARLEDRLGRDPFAQGDDLAFPVTFGDFVRLYEPARV